MGDGVGHARLGDGHGEHHRSAQDEQQFPFYIFGHARDTAATEQHHQSSGKHGRRHQGQQVER